MHAMNETTAATYLILPGLRDHVAEHWQTLLQAELPGDQAVPPLEQDKLSRAARVDALQRAVDAIDGPIIVVAHSAGCITLVHWALQYPQHTQRIKAALLATPSDMERPLPAGYPSLEALEQGGWLPVPRSRLPFRSLLAVSRNDALASFERVREYAQDWGSELVDIGNVGHLNPAAGYGPWAQAHGLLARLG